MTNYMWEQVYNLIHDMGGKDVLLNVVHERNEVLHTLLYGGIYVLYNIHSRGQWCTILYTMRGERMYNMTYYMIECGYYMLYYMAAGV